MPLSVSLCTQGTSRSQAGGPSTSTGKTRLKGARSLLRRQARSCPQTPRRPACRASAGLTVVTPQYRTLSGRAFRSHLSLQTIPSTDWVTGGDAWRQTALLV